MASSYLKPYSSDDSDSNDRDSRLIVRIHQHDEQALDTLYARYGKLIFTLALHITGDRTTAEEATQDTFLSIWQSAGTFQEGSSTAAWLIGIARHRAIDLTRGRNYRFHAHSTVLSDTFTSHTDVHMEQLAETLSIQAALRTLSTKQYEVIALAYYSGLTQSEIAAQLNVPLGTIKARMRIGLLKLRELLYDTANDEEIHHLAVSNR